ncbi:hypothetical protein CYG49_01445 [Candidatus Saccharibacteria bacterium]|nr:MAG: hypothetical protein CYG49_01445 [Candidatus Saccharibacteria bacterium]
MNKKENINIDKSFPLVGAFLATAFGALILTKSSGLSLIVTFLPAIPIAFLGFWLISWRRGHNYQCVLPVYLFAVAWQLLHFAEEYITGFNAQFPDIVDGSPAYPIETFVLFNMVAYFFFILGAVFGLIGRHKIFMLPVWFFAVYGVCGNAIAHVIFAVINNGYFPGLITALGYFIIGPILIKRLVEAPKLNN